VLRIVDVAFCRAALFGSWNEPPRRRYAAYRCREGSPRLLGHPVVDEFATLSSPLFVTPRALVGKIYDSGLSLAHRRDAEMAIDLGWPPLVVGLDAPAPVLPADWEAVLRSALEAPAAPGDPLAGADAFARRTVGTYELQLARFGTADLLATSAPLLPKQLARLCETSSQPLSIAVAAGHPVLRSADARPLVVEVLSERRLGEILEVARGMGS